MITVHARHSAKLSACNVHVGILQGEDTSEQDESTSGQAGGRARG